MGISIVAAVLALATPAPQLSDSIWVEATLPANPPQGVTEQPTNPQVVSEGKWIHYSVEKATPDAAPVTLSYAFRSERAGRFRWWARVGFEWVRADLDVRVNGGAWQSFPASRATTNVVQVAVWTEVAWARGEVLDLKAGENTVEVRFSRRKDTDRYLFALDALTFVPEGMEWRPDNLLRPGQRYDAAIDREAEGIVTKAPASNAPRQVVKLANTWQVARLDDPDMNVGTYEPVKALPTDLNWRGIQVPKDAWATRPDLTFGHTLVYRTKVDVPAGKPSAWLHFEGFTWIASVFVNGEYVRGVQSVLVPVDLDISGKLKPGENTIEIAIKGSWYAMDHEPGKLMMMRNQPRSEEFLKYIKWIDSTWPTGKGGGDSTATGLIRPVQLVIAGPAYTSDVFVRSNVKAMRLLATTEVTNPGTGARSITVRTEALNDANGAVAKRFADKTVTVAAGSTQNVELDEAWADAKLWWPAEAPGDRPTCYRLRTTLLENGQPIDVKETLFGFRELGVDGRHVLLNGVRWRPYTWNSMGLSFTPGGLNEYFRLNDRGVRFEGGLHQDFFDREGIPGRLSMCFEGMFGQVAMNNPRTWENWKIHTAQMVRAYRNSPSIMHWSVGNEVMMITGRLFFFGDTARHEKQMAEVFAVAKSLDPTRTVSEDGAGDIGGMGDSNNWHYVTGEYKLPHQFYKYDIGPVLAARNTQDMNQLYRWDGKRPLVQGEEFYFPGAGNFAWFGGPKVYRGMELREQAGGRYGRMYTEGARWQDVFIAHPCTPPVPTIEVSMARQAVFVREYNSVFAPGSPLVRTIKVFNDSRHDAALTFRWSLLLNGKAVLQGTKPYALKAGLNQEDVLRLALPKDPIRRDYQLVLSLESKGKRIFRDTKKITVLPTLAPTPTKQLAVWDPSGRVTKWLSARGQAMTALNGVTAIPASARVVLVGPGAITEENKTAVAAALRAFVTRGNTAIVLEQKVPLRGTDLPTAGIEIADRERGRAARPEWEKVGGHTGGISHPMALAHGVLRDLKPDDFFTWNGADELNYRLSYGTPPTGTVNLIQAGEDLSLAPMFEVIVGRGSYLLSQMLIGEKLGVDPVAARLLQNSIAWASSKAEAKPKRTTVVTGGDEEFEKIVESLGIVHQNSTSILDALKGDVAIVRATPAAMATLAANQAAVKAMANRGGWLMLVELDAKGLADFNKLVGVTHRLREFRKEKVVIEAMEDPMMMGISDRDLQQFDPEVIASWIGLNRVSGKVFTSVVDSGPEIASFATLNTFGEGANRPLTDGLMSDTMWHYTQYLRRDGTEPIIATFDRAETITSVDLYSSGAYHWPKDFQILLDDKVVKTGTLKAAMGWQTFPIPATKAQKVSVRFTSTYPPTRIIGAELITIDEMRIRRQLPTGFSTQVVPLTNVGGLVKYPMGKGGVILNQLNWGAGDQPENMPKKKIVFSSLLRNMGASFRG